MSKKQQIYRGRKFQQVCDGARLIFLRDGYEGASVDDISRAAGVSKATLYSYFPHKRLMFEEVLRNEIDRAAQQLAQLPGSDLPPSEGLRFILHAIMRDAASTMQTGLYQLCIAESRRFPRLAQTYHDRILSLRSIKLKDYLDHWVARGQLDIADTSLAADQLLQLTGMVVIGRAALLSTDRLTEAEAERLCSNALDLFLPAHAAQESPRPMAAAQ